MDVFRQALLYAVRVLRKDRAYSAAVILTLAHLPRRQHRHLHRRPVGVAAWPRSILYRDPRRGHRSCRHLIHRVCRAGPARRASESSGRSVAAVGRV